MGYSLVETLRNDNKNEFNPHMIRGTLTIEENPIPNGVYAIINTDNI